MLVSITDHCTICSPPVRISSPMDLPGFPADFQPSCIAEITFNVKAKTIEGEDIVILGNTVTLANGDPEKAVPMDGDNAPNWNITLEQPANTQISYEYGKEYLGTKTIRRAFSHEGIQAAML